MSDATPSPGSPEEDAEYLAHRATRRGMVNNHDQIWAQGEPPLSRRQALSLAEDLFGPCLYAIRLPASGVIKIGFSQALHKRISNYGKNVEVLAIRPRSTIDDETAVHRMLVTERYCGREYYNPTPPVLAVINEWRSHLGREPLAA